MFANTRSLLLLALLTALSARAQQPEPQVTLIFLQHYVEAETLRLNARMRVTLSEPMIDALRHGIPLYFSTRFELVEQTRLMGLLPQGRTVSTLTQPVQLTWSPFDRRWWLHNLRSGRTVSAATLKEALEILGTFSDIALARTTALHPGIPYLIRLRLRLDAARLPLPLWLETRFDPHWRLDSGWLEDSVDERKLWQR